LRSRSLVTLRAIELHFFCACGGSLHEQAVDLILERKSGFHDETAVVRARLLA